MSEQYRFNDSTGAVYELRGDSYIFIGDYHSYGITASMSDDAKAAAVSSQNDEETV